MNRNKSWEHVAQNRSEQVKTRFKVYRQPNSPTLYSFRQGTRGKLEAIFEAGGEFRIGQVWTGRTEVIFVLPNGLKLTPACCLSASELRRVWP